MGLDDLSKEELKELVKIYAKNIIALDGVWFQSNEKKNGIDQAMQHDKNAWTKFTVTEARRIKKFIGLEEHPGLEGLKKALSIRFSAQGNPVVKLYNEGDFLIYRVDDCRVQSARKKKGMPFHPCKSVGIIEHAYFAKTIDDRIKTEAVSCFPEITDESSACIWKFSIPQK